MSAGPENSVADDRPVYVIVDLEVTDRQRFAEYVQGHRASVERFGGRFLVRGGNPEPLEGDWEPGRVVVQRWPNVEAFRRWYDSEEYRPWKELRQRSASANVVLVEGIEPAEEPAAR